MSIFDVIANAESRNRTGITNPTSTSSGNATGIYQITPGTWSDFAPQAGVTTPQSQASPVEQAQVASVIPLSRWAPSTVSAVQAQYPGLDTSQPVGVLADQTGGFSSLPAGSGGSSSIPIGPYASEGYGSGAVGSDGQSYIDVVPGNGGTQAGSAYGTSSGGSLAASGGSSPSTMVASAEAATPGYIPPSQTGGPYAVGLAPGLAAGIGGWIGDVISGAQSSVQAGIGAAQGAVSGLFGGIENWVVRAFLIIIGVVILGIALIRMMDPDFSPRDVAAAAA